MFYAQVRILNHELSQGWDCRQQNYKRVVCLCFILQSEFFIMGCPRAGIVGSKITNAQCIYVLYSSQNSLSWAVLGLGLQAAKLQTRSVFMFYTQVRILNHGLSQGCDCRQQNYKHVVCLCFILKSEFLIMGCPRAAIVDNKITNAQCVYVLYSSQNSLSWAVLGLGLQATKLQTRSVCMFYAQVRILYHGLFQGWDCRQQNYKRVVCLCFMLKSEFFIMVCPRAGIVGNKITNAQCVYVLCSSQNSLSWSVPGLGLQAAKLQTCSVFMFYTQVRILYHELSQGWDCRQQNYKRVVCLCFILKSEFFIMSCPRAGIVGSKITNAQCVYVLCSSQNSLS